MPVAHILTDPSNDWKKVLSNARGRNRYAFREIQVNWKKYNPFDYLFSHVSIVTSVKTDETGYRIEDPCDELVNANGNAWTNFVLSNCFRTFIGGYNFLEHQQVPETSKGIILDAVLRPVTHIGRNGKKADVYTCDLLIATNRSHESLIERIESGELKTLSMGGCANIVQCSICGKQFKEGESVCYHLNNCLKQYVTCEDGKKRIVAELCGGVDKNGEYIPESFVFIEASWVKNPAFGGAVVNYFVDSEQHMKMEEEKNNLSTIWSENNILSMRCADRYNGIAIRLANKTYNEIMRKNAEL